MQSKAPEALGEVTSSDVTEPVPFDVAARRHHANRTRRQSRYFHGGLQWRKLVNTFAIVMALVFVVPGLLAIMAGVSTGADVLTMATQVCSRPEGSNGVQRTNNDLSSWSEKRRKKITDWLKVPEPRPRSAAGSERSYLGFFNGNVNYVYFAALFFLGLHVRTSWPSRPRVRRKVSRVVGTGGIALILCVLWMGHNVVRTFWLTGDERKIVSYVNWDISPISWSYQLFLSLVVCVLLALSWDLSRFAQFRVRAKTTLWPNRSRFLDEPEKRTLYKLQNRAIYVGSLFDTWQIQSCLLAAAFLPWTLYYWSLGRLFGDHRYYWSTLTVHVLWGFTWVLLSVPLFVGARRFNAHRSAVATALEVTGHKSAEYAGKIMPVSTIRLAMTGVAAVATFVGPLLGIKA